MSQTKKGPKEHGDIDGSALRADALIALPTAVRALNDHELRVLLIALLQEWRGRTELMRGSM